MFNNKYLNSASWLLLEKVIRVFAELSVGILLLRYLQPENYGAYSYILSITAIFVAVSVFGLDQVVLKKCSEVSDNYLIKLAALQIRALSSLLVFFVAIFLLSFSSVIEIKWLLFIASIVIIFNFSSVIEQFYIVEAQASFIAKVKISQNLVSIVLKLFCIFTQKPLFYFILIYCLDALFVSVFLVFGFLIGAKKLQLFKVDLEKWKELLKPALPLFLASISVMLYMRIDQVMITHMLGERENGVYSAAVKLSEFWYFIPTILCASLFPIVVKYKQQSYIKYKSAMAYLYSAMFYLSLFFYLGIMLFGSYIITVLFGSAYSESYDVLKIHALSGVFVGLGVASSYWLVNENLESISLERTLAGCVINILLNLMLIPSFGIRGAAWSTLISYMIAGYLYDVIRGNTREMFLQKTLAPFFIVR